MRRNLDFDKAELMLYEPVEKMPPFSRKTLVFIRDDNYIQCCREIHHTDVKFVGSRNLSFDFFVISVH